MRSRDGCMPAAYVDGFAQPDGADEIDRLVRPDRVKGIEIYANALETPPQFILGDASHAMAPPCAAVVIWSK